MDTRQKSGAQVKLLTGNAAAAHAVRLCKPEVVAGYPITPQTEIWDILYRFQADGLFKGEMVEPESEHSVMSIVTAASAAGARTFTATASQGLMYMFEPYVWVAAQRLPVVMVNANRETASPTSVTGSQQDILTVKEAGWVQLHVESCQEVLDTIIMAYRLAEDPDILLPVTVAYDGFFLSYFSEAVNIPEQDKVDRFAPKRQRELRIDPDVPLSISPWPTSDMVTEYRAKHQMALERSKAKLESIETEFKGEFGRSYGGQIEEYRCQDADIVLVAMGSGAGTAKVAVDQRRAEGLKVGLIKVRMFRPFPRERLVNALSGKKAIGVVDRDVCFGWNSGHLMMELKAALFDLERRMPMLNFIGGLSSSDLTVNLFKRVINKLASVTRGKPWKETTYLDLE